jgi:AraC-like DNA-binding protein
MLIGLVSTLIEEIGGVAEGARAGPFAGPLTDWENRQVIDFIDRLRTSTGDEYMGLGSGPCPLGASDFVIELGTRCATLREAILMAFRFMRMATAALGFDLAEDQDRAVITIAQQPSSRDPANVLADWAMITWHKLPQWLIGSEIWLDRTEFARPLTGSYASYAAMFGSHCVFNSDAGRLVFARSYLDRRVIRRAGEGDRLKAITPADFTRSAFVARTWKQRIRNILLVELAAGRSLPALEDLAAEFDVSSQTLRRRLKDEGTSYRSLKAAARVEVALGVLTDETAKFGEASIAAGFAEPNELARALKASRGVTPKELREQVLHGRGRSK